MKVLVDVWFDEPESLFELSDVFELELSLLDVFELLELESGGFVLDTPGFSSLEIENIKADDLWQYFPEMADSQNKCRFRGCSHINEPDCYIKEKLENGEMAQSRYDSYTQIYNKLKSVKEWEKK